MTGHLGSIMLAGILTFAGGCPKTPPSSSGPAPLNPGSTPMLSPDPTSGVGATVVVCGLSNSNFISTNTGSVQLLVNHDYPNTLTVTDTYNGQSSTLSSTPPAQGQSYNTPSGEYYTLVSETVLQSNGTNAQAMGEFDTIVIQAPNGFTLGVPHMYQINEQNSSTALTVNITYMATTNVALAANNLAPVPPPICNSAVPGAPQNPTVVQKSLSAVGATGTAVLQWQPVWWTQKMPNGQPDGCAESDTYVLQISPNNSFSVGPPGQNQNYATPSEIAETVFNMPSTGQPNTGNPPLIPNPTNGQTLQAQATVCQRGSGGSLTPQVTQGPDPLTTDWGWVNSPDFSQENAALWGNANLSLSCSNEPLLFFRVRAGYYGNLGPWSQTASFTIPCPVQFPSNAPTTAPKCPFQGGTTKECLAWEPVSDAIGYTIRVAPDAGTPLPLSVGVLAPGEQDFNIGIAALAGGADPNEPQCFIVGQAQNPPVWCGLWNQGVQMSTSSTMMNLTSGTTYRWDVRALYSSNGLVGPWTPDILTKW